MKPNTKRNEEILKLRNDNKLSFGKIGNYFDIKRQTVHEIYTREMAKLKEEKE